MTMMMIVIIAIIRKTHLQLREAILSPLLLTFPHQVRLTSDIMTGRRFASLPAYYTVKVAVETNGVR